MALTTAAAFNEFKEKLLLTDPQKELVKSRRTTTAGYLVLIRKHPSRRS